MKLHDIKPGMVVRYHPIIGRTHDGKLYTVSVCGLLPSGHKVAWLKEKSGCVAIEAISLPKPEEIV